jgi:hypothetical protein
MLDKHFLMLILIFRTRSSLEQPFELNQINTNLIFSSQNAVVSLMEQNGWEVKLKWSFV